MAKILLVEDNEMNRDLLSRRMKRAGFEVLLAGNGAEGIEKVKSESPDLIVLDMSLPVLDGYEAARILKGNSTTQRIPILGLSAHAMSGDAAKALDAGCDDYDTKPVEWPRLLAKIQSLLSKVQATMVLAPAPAAGADDPHLSTKTVLIAADSALYRQILSRRVADLGFRAELAEEGEEVLIILERRPCDAVLLGLQVGAMAGKTLLERIRADARWYDLPVLMLSPIDAVETALACLEAGAQDFVLQPYPQQVLATRLQACFERRQLHALEQRWQEHEQALAEEQARCEFLLRVLLPAPLIDELHASARILPRQVPDVALLACDLVQLNAQCDAPDPLPVLAQFHQLVMTCEDLCARHAALLVRLQGESLLAAVGLFQAAANPIENCVRLALDLLQAARQISPAGMTLRLGIHIGSVVAGVIGQPRYHFDIWGSAVPFTALIKNYGQPNTVNLSAAAWPWIAESCVGGPVGQIALRDGSTLVLYRVERLAS